MSELSPTAALIGDGQQHHRALVALLVPLTFGSDTFPEPCWVWLLFFS